MPLLDSHAHLDFLFRDEDRRNRHKNSMKCYLDGHPFPTPIDFMGVVADWCRPSLYHTAAPILRADSRVLAAFGCHPHWSGGFDLRVQNSIIEHLEAFPQAVAWGEMGLDYSNHRPNNPPPDPKLQRRVFRQQLQTAVRRGFPVVIHGRDAEDDLFKVMKAVVPRDHPIQRHCVTVPPLVLEPWKKYFRNCKFGFTNLLDRKGTRGVDIRESVAMLPLQRIVVETDAPHHPPASFRPTGSRWASHRPTSSHPGMVGEVVKGIAKVKGIPPHVVAQQVYKNTCELYNLW